VLSWEVPSGEDNKDEDRDKDKELQFESGNNNNTSVNVIGDETKDNGGAAMGGDKDVAIA
jgi:hypothetical protein